MKSCPGISLLLAALLWCSSARGEEILLGVLEGANTPNRDSIKVRLLFAREKNQWVALEDSRILSRYQLAGQEWTLARNGQKAGAVHLVDIPLAGGDLYAWSYKRDKIFAIDSTDSIPVIKTPAGYSGAAAFILHSKPYFIDSERWTPFKPGPQYRRKLYQPLKIVVGRFKALKCVGLGEVVPFRFKPEDLKVFQGFKSAKGAELVSIGLDSNRINCSSRSEPAWSANWFLILGTDIDHIGCEMDLLDTGYYDNDGRSEALFWTSGYNRGRYILVYSGFEKKAEYIWCYH